MKEMKENNEKLKEAIIHLEEAHRVLVGLFELDEESKEEPKKVTLTINIKHDFDEGTEFSDEELEQLKKDLEEIMNDFTGK